MWPGLVVIYPAFAGSRIDADLASATTPSLILHPSGWNPQATGLKQGAQSEYARYVAELGVGGVLFLIALALTAVVALWRDFPHGPAVAGSLAVAAVGLAFDNALETLSISAIAAVMLAIACTRAGTAGSRREPTPEPKV